MVMFDACVLVLSFFFFFKQKTAYDMRISDWSSDVCSSDLGNPSTVVPGLMAIGEAACVSVHGANRLGSNSLLDLVVFGRSAARRCAEILTPGEKQAPLRVEAGDAALDPFDRLRHADGEIPTALLREEMQPALQGHAAVLDRKSKRLNSMH